MIHKDLKQCFKAWKTGNERVCYAYLHVNKIRAVVVYMPHAQCKTVAVMNVYKQLEKIAKDAQKSGYRMMIAVDWNAVVGGALPQ